MPTESGRHIIIARHGALNNPNGILYNRDTVMRPEDIMHLSETGKTGVQELAKAIKDGGYNCVVLYTSPEIRAIESSQILAKTLGIAGTETIDELDDVLCPAPYLAKMSIRDLENRGGDLYDLCQEKPDDIVRRMEPVFWNLAGKLQNGETGIIMSHGDPTALLLHKLINHTVPEPKKLRDNLYLPKSGAVAITIGENRKITSWNPISVTGAGEIY
jgi:broad specificity phosphatase PhoE